MQLIYCLFSREENADKLLIRDIKINNKIWCQLIVFQWNNISGQSYHLSGKWQSSSNFGMNCVIFSVHLYKLKNAILSSLSFSGKTSANTTDDR